MLLLAALPAIPARAADRVYEKVSPADKGGLSVLGRGTRSVSEDGDGIVFAARAAAPGGASGSPTVFIGRRPSATRSGWSTWDSHPIDPPTPPGGFHNPNYTSFSGDLLQSIVMAYSGLAPGAAANSPQLYVRDDTAGTYDLVTPAAGPSGAFPPALHPEVGGATPDFTTVAYDSPVTQTSSATPDVYNAYVWVHGKTLLAGLVDLDGPGPLQPEPAPSGTRVGSNASFGGSVEHALSADARRVFFHTIQPDVPAPGDQSNQGELWVWDSQGTSSEIDDTSEQVSASQRTDCADQVPCSGVPEPDPAGELPAFYWTAEPQRGSKVLYTSCEKLTDDSTAYVGSTSCSVGGASGGVASPGSDLYEYDVDTNELSDLTTADPAGANVFGVVGASDDLGTVYVVAGGVLAPGGSSGQPNLYIWRDGTTKFIGTLDASVRFRTLVDSDNWSAAGPFRAPMSRVTPSGSHILFTSREPLTSNNNVNVARCPPFDAGSTTQNPDGRCLQVFMYARHPGGEPGELRCLSCDPSGAPPAGDARLLSSGGVPGFTPDALPANLRADGRQAFFETRNALDGRDVNGKYDVYEWDTGELTLVSGGAGAQDSLFADASADGADVFFTTYDRLVDGDEDEFGDLYDARVGGERAPRRVTPPECEGDECQPPSSGRPRLGVIGRTISGDPGNVKLRRPRFSVSRLSTAQQRRFLRKGTVRLRVRVNERGTITISVAAKSGGRTRVIARTSKLARRAGPVAVTVKLPRPISLRDFRAHMTKLTLAVRFSTAETKTMTILRRQRGTK